MARRGRLGWARPGETRPGQAGRGSHGGVVMSDLRDQLLAVRERHGELTPRALMEDARDPDHPLHFRVFDKPVEEAAEAYYLDNARRLIQVVKLPPQQDAKGNEYRLRAFQSVRRESGHVYEPTEEIAQDPIVSQLLLMEMRREWKAMQARYGQFKEFAQMVQSSLEDGAA